MPTPTADKLRIYYPSKYLTADGDELTQFTVTSAGLREVTCSALTQAGDFFNGAVGWFDGDTITPELAGIFFHVRDFDQTSNALSLSRDLPVTPQTGDTFRLVIGGLFRSSTETFGLKVGGVLPELSPVECTNITGVTIKKASGKLGEGDLIISYDGTLGELYIKMDNNPYGIGLDVSNDLVDAIVFAEDQQGYIQIDVTAADLPATNATELFTLVYPKAVFTPDYEGYETAKDCGGKIRYRLEVVKNTDSTDTMVDLSVFTAVPDGSPTTLVSSTGTDEGFIDLADASDWPTRSFWIKNTTVNGGIGDCRYVKYRSGHRLYFESAGTGLRDYIATNWSVGDNVEVMGDIDIALQAPDESGLFDNPASETDPPVDLDFYDVTRSTNALYIGDLWAGQTFGVWRRETILDNHRARPDVTGDCIYFWS